MLKSNSRKWRKRWQILSHWSILVMKEGEMTEEMKGEEAQMIGGVTEEAQRRGEVHPVSLLPKRSPMKQLLSLMATETEGLQTPEAKAIRISGAMNLEVASVVVFYRSDGKEMDKMWQEVPNEAGLPKVTEMHLIETVKVIEIVDVAAT